MSTSRHATPPHARRIATASAAAIAGLALTMGAVAAPAQAQDLVPQSDKDAKKMIEDDQAEDSGSLNKSNVPQGVSVEQARQGRRQV